MPFRRARTRVHSQLGQPSQTGQNALRLPTIHYTRPPQQAEPTCPTAANSSSQLAREGKVWAPRMPDHSPALRNRPSPCEVRWHAGQHGRCEAAAGIWGSGQQHEARGQAHATAPGARGGEGEEAWRGGGPGRRGRRGRKERGRVWPAAAPRGLRLCSRAPWRCARRPHAARAACCGSAPPRGGQLLEKERGAPRAPARRTRARERQLPPPRQRSGRFAAGRRQSCRPGGRRAAPDYRAAPDSKTRLFLLIFSYDFRAAPDESRLARAGGSEALGGCRRRVPGAAPGA